MEMKKVRLPLKFFLTKKRQFCSLVTNKKLFTNGASCADQRNLLKAAMGRHPKLGKSYSIFREKGGQLC